MITIICQQCNGEFQVLPHRKNTAKFCSFKCHGKYVSKFSGFQKNHPFYKGGEKNWFKMGENKTPNWYKTMQGRIPWNKEKKIPQISGKNHWNWQGGPFQKECLSCKKRFKTHYKNRKYCSKECQLKHQNYLSGEQHWNYQGGITPLENKIRGNIKYKKWINIILLRDNWTCQKCRETRHTQLTIHHIKNFAKIIKENNIKTLEQALSCDELWDISNGITICRHKCHKEFHKIYSRKNNTKQQLEEFLSQ